MSNLFVHLQIPTCRHLSSAASVCAFLLGIRPLDFAVVEADFFKRQGLPAVRRTTGAVRRDYGIRQFNLIVFDFVASCAAELERDLLDMGTVGACKG